MAGKTIEPRERKRVTNGPAYKEKLSDNCGSLYIFIGTDPEGICEIFVIKGKSGGCVGAFAEAVGRLASIALASGVPPEQIIRQLRGIRCPHPKMTSEGTIFSCPDAIAKTLDRFVNRNQPKGTLSDEPIKTHTSTEKKDESVVAFGEKPDCPECGTMLIKESGCLICKSCGWSKCP
jgi:ribonucleoside-diphosphate reductase alpha chain